MFTHGIIRRAARIALKTQWPQGLLVDFATPAFASGFATYGSITNLPAYAYARSGAMSVQDSDGGIDDFAANVLPVNGYGVHSYKAANNRLIRSKEFTASGWSATGNTGTNPVVTADQTAAPDGTTTADKIVFGAVSGAGKVSNVLRSFTSFNGAQTASIWIKGNAGGEQLYIWLLTGTTYIKAARITCTTNWQRIVLPATLNGAVWSFAIGCDLRDATQTATVAQTVYVWQAQVLDGSYPDGGPLVATAAAAANTFSPDLHFGLETGSYSATYTFDDGSTQVVATTVVGSRYVLPTYPDVLNRPRVKSFNLIPS